MYFIVRYYANQQTQKVEEVNFSSFLNETIESLVRYVDIISEQFNRFKNQIKDIFCSYKQIQLENKAIKNYNN